MWSRHNISPKRKNFLLWLGVMAAFVILTNRSLYYYDLSDKLYADQEQQYGEKEGVADVDGENNEGDSDTVPQGQSILKASDDAIASISLLHIEHHLYFISEIVLSELDLDCIKYEVFHEFTPYFKVLFRRIISPNAP